MQLRSIFLWLFIINLGIALGAGLYEQRVVISQWANLPPRAWPKTGLIFWAYVTTVPLTLLTIANLVAAWLDRSLRRKWWLTATGIVFLERIVTFSYFIPKMIALTSSDLPVAEVNAGLSDWLLFNHGRHILTFAGWLAALRALSLSASNAARDRMITL